MHGRSPLIADNRWIEKVFHPVFPPDRNADGVLAWPRNNIDSGAPADAVRRSRVAALTLSVNAAKWPGYADNHSPEHRIERKSRS